MQVARPTGAVGDVSLSQKERSSLNFSIEDIKIITFHRGHGLIVAEVDGTGLYFVRLAEIQGSGASGSGKTRLSGTLLRPVIVGIVMSDGSA